MHIRICACKQVGCHTRLCRHAHVRICAYAHTLLHAHVRKLVATHAFADMRSECAHMHILCYIHVIFSFIVHLFHLQDQRLWFPSTVTCQPTNTLSETVNQATTFANGYYTILQTYSNVRWHLRCFRGKKCALRVRTSNHSTQSKRARDKSELCNFYIPVSYCTDRKLFYIRKNGGCNFTHNGHFRLDQEMMKLGIKSIPADIREDAASMLAQHIPTAIIAKIVKIRSKNYLTSDSLKSLRRTVFADNGGDSKTVAERTLDLLRKEKGCNYSYILGSMDYAKSLITIRKGSWKMPKKSSISVAGIHGSSTSAGRAGSFSIVTIRIGVCVHRPSPYCVEIEFGEGNVLGTTGGIGIHQLSKSHIH